MKILSIVVAFVFSGFYCAVGQEGKLISDCTVFFEVLVEGSKVDPRVAKSMAGTTKVLYIKGSKIRSDLITPSFKQTMFADAKSDSIIIIRELGSTKYISYLNESKMKEQNKKYEGIKFNNTNEKKTILGYNCKKVIARLPDGSTYNVFYTPSITPTNKQYEYQFKDLPGFVLQYEEESEDGKTKIKYSAIKISLESVPNSKFNLPKSGYRII